MTPTECAREAEVVAAVMRRQLDVDRLDEVAPLEGIEDVRRHVQQCDICADVVAVASLLRDDRDAARPEVHVPAAGQVWWRAAVRARLDGAHAAARPLTWAQGVAAASMVGVLVAVLSIAWPTIDNAATWVGSRAWSVAPAALTAVDLVTSAVQRSLPFAIGVAAAMVLAPLALYLALADD